MAWDWVPPVAVATAGVAGIIATWLTGKQGREHAETVNREKLAHDRQLAQEERVQQRLERAYVELLDMTESAGHWAHIVLPLFDTSPPREEPDLPSLKDQAHIGALVKAFGSAEVKALEDAWQSVIRDMITQHTLIKYEEQANRIDTSGRREFDEMRPRELEAREALADRIAIELGHRGDVSGPPNGHQ